MYTQRRHIIGAEEKTKQQKQIYKHTNPHLHIHKQNKRAQIKEYVFGELKNIVLVQDGREF